MVESQGSNNEANQSGDSVLSSANPQPSSAANNGEGGSPPPPPAHIEMLTAPPGLDANLPPMASAGIALARIVLLILAGAIAALVIYLFYTDEYTDGSIRQSYTNLLTRTAATNTISSPATLETWQSTLQSALADTSINSSTEQQKSEQQTLDELSRYLLISERQSDMLETCVDLSKLPAAARPEKIEDCIDVIRLLKRDQSDAVSNAAVTAEAAKNLAAQTQADHAFWLQIAQLLLLNLLLPLLTGLFGYIFGTTQQQSSPA